MSDDKRVAQMEIGDLEIDDVRALLRENAIDPTTLAEPTLQLLRVPLHLSVFSRLSQDAQRATYRTLPELYQRYTDDVRCIVERQVGHLAWDDITGPLVRYMNEYEQLEAPSRLLGSTSPSERRALFSHGVLVENGLTIRFLHETYFDFLFAQAFVADRRDLHDFLAGSGQFLFRRAQTRQVLEYLVATDRRAFRQTVVRILSSDTIRAHLRDVALTVLRQLDADADDWHAIEPLAFGTSAFSQRITALLSVPAWFDAADAAGRWEKLLADPATVDAAAHQMVIAARERADRVAALVRPYVGASEQWRLRLRALVEWSLRPALVGLAVELTERGDLDDARGPIAVNSDFWSIVHSIHSDDPAGAARLMGAFLRRGIARVEADGSADPFESQHLSRHTASGSSLIVEIATAAPAVFVDEVLPVVVLIASHTACATNPHDLQIARRWGWRHVGSVDSVDDAVFDGVDTALRLLAHDQPGNTIDRVQPLSTSDIRELRFLACRTYAAAGASDGAIAWLLSDHRNLHLGWTDSRNWASRELIEVATRSCSETMLERLALHLLAYYPDREKGMDARPYRGLTQYEVLTAIDEGRRSAAVRRRIGELERKFSGFPPEPPQPVEVGWVGPPIPQNAAKFMSDEDWRRAIIKYRTASHSSGRMLLGGCEELAGLLGSQAKEEPERFARLALTFGPGTPGAHFSHVIRSVAKHVPVELLAELCRHARHAAAQDGVDRDICFAIYTARSNANDNLVEILEQCAVSGDDPVLWAYQESDSSEQPDCRDDLHTAGLNSTRGAATSAIARILFASPTYADRLTPTISTLAQDRCLEVRVVAAEAVRALARHRPDAALDIAQTLFADTPMDVFNNDLTCRLLLTCVLPRPSIFSKHLERALEGPESVARRAGMVWAVAYLQDALADPLRMKPDELPTAARRGAASQLAANPSAVPDELIQLLNDEDPDVRDAAATSVRALDQVETTAAQRLITAFVSSPAFEDHFDGLFRSLERSTRLLPEETIAACERAVELAGRSFGDIRTRHFATSEKIVTVVLRLYRQGGQRLRTRCLDAVDRLAEVGAYGLDKALADER
ncbi:MAG: hypothetical protein JXA67_21090 [Micromonosporaceae bacterium]|nr:hypothetical protein [Micromonosporaceae bacterium]